MLRTLFFLSFLCRLLIFRFHSLEGLCCHVLLMSLLSPIYTDSSFYSGLAGNITFVLVLGRLKILPILQLFKICSSKVPDMIFIHESPQRWCKILGSLNLEDNINIHNWNGQVLNLVKHHKLTLNCLCDRDLHIRSLSLIVGCPEQQQHLATS